MTRMEKLRQDYFRVWVKTQWKSAESEAANHICQHVFRVTVNLIRTVILGNTNALPLFLSSL